AYDDAMYRPDFAVEDSNPQLPDAHTLQNGAITSLQQGKVVITDLDRNGHMNNARYADIVVNSCDFDYYATHTIKAFDFNFLAEMTIGNEYTVFQHMRENVSYFEANGNMRTDPIFRARIQWA
ncbi:MAG: hypothetical protein K2L51_03600, partial [Clostridiales bacterium]|nr:hypothetical protein [Clostridiales bacterium]